MSSANSEHPLMGLVKPVWVNTHWVRNALEQCEAIGCHAKELNQVHGHFWGITQKFALDSAVLGICKLYDKTNKRYRKYTIPELISYLEKNFTVGYATRLKQESLCSLNILAEDAKIIIASFESSALFEQMKNDLLNKISTVIPTVSPDTPLDRLFMYRDKFLAHQEWVDEAVKEQMEFLPPLEEMHKINNWAESFCEFMGSFQIPVDSFSGSPGGGRMAM